MLMGGLRNQLTLLFNRGRVRSQRTKNIMSVKCHFERAQRSRNLSISQ